MPVFWTGVIPKGISIVIDREKIGEFLVKKDVYIEIREFSEPEKARLLNENPGLTKEIIDEKIKLLAYEVIRFDLFDPEAFVLLQSSEK